MKHLRAKFLALLLLLNCSGLSQAQEELQLSHETKTYCVELAADKPEFASFWVDSLGKGRKWTNGMLGGSSKQTYHTSLENGWIRYSNKQTDASTLFKSIISP
jgi:hypothetical protein